jgi:hypothetical protein
MLVVVDGKFQPTVPYDTIQIAATLADALPRVDFDIWDQGGQMFFDVDQEVIVWNENAPPINGGATPSPPSQNYLINPQWAFGAANWNDASLGHITYPATNAVLSFGNIAVFSYYIWQTTLKGYAHPGVQYMLSVYALEASLVNGNAFIAIQFQDAANNVLGSTTYNTFTPTTSNTRYNVSATAPANTMFIVAQVGGNATNSTNSGTITFSSVQLEPMWFVTERISYPTPDLNTSQVSVYLLPDNTCSRYARFFAGFIDDVQWEWDGKLKIWHISCAGAQAILENGLINGVYTAQYDDQILSSVVNTYFNTVIALTAPNNFAPSPVVRGVLMDDQNYTDNTFREVVNGLTDSSGYMGYMDPYYRLFYNPSFYNVASFALSDTIWPASVYGAGSYGVGPYGVASSSTSPYYDYSGEKDATQRKRRIKIIGGHFDNAAITDLFSGNGSNTVFSPLSQYPKTITSVSVGGTQYKTGTKGRDTFNSGGFAALVDKVNKTLTFSSAPATGTNNIAITYTYEAMVVTQVLDQDAKNAPLAPAYAVPTYDSKVNDTNLISTTTANTRGLAEVSKFGSPLTIIRCKSQQYAPIGFIIYFTATLDNIINQPYVVQQVTGRYLGNGINEFEYQLGYYQPTLLDHIHNANKALNRSPTTANVNTILQVDLAVREPIVYSELITLTPGSSTPAGVYGTAKYAGNSYS